MTNDKTGEKKYDLEVNPELEIVEQREPEVIEPAGEAAKTIETEKLPAADSSSTAHSQPSTNDQTTQAINAPDTSASTDGVALTADDIIYKTFEDLLKLINKGVSSTTEFARKIYEVFLQARK